MTEPTYTYVIYYFFVGTFLIHRHAVHVGLTSFFLTNDPRMKHVPMIMSGWELLYITII